MVRLSRRRRPVPDPRKTANSRNGSAGAGCARSPSRWRCSPWWSSSTWPPSSGSAATWPAEDVNCAWQGRGEVAKSHHSPLAIRHSPLPDQRHDRHTQPPAQPPAPRHRRVVRACWCRHGGGGLRRGAALPHVLRGHGLRRHAEAGHGRLERMLEQDRRRPLRRQRGARPAVALRAGRRPRMTVKLGENAVAVYRATNSSDKRIVATAAYNIFPEIAASYFSKIECFCFTEQVLEPGQSAELAAQLLHRPRHRHRQGRQARHPRDGVLHVLSPAATPGRGREADQQVRIAAAGTRTPSGTQDDERGRDHGRRPRREASRLSPREPEPLAACSARCAPSSPRWAASSGCARWAAARACSACAGRRCSRPAFAGILLHHVHVVARRDQGGARRRPHAGGAAAPALRHDPVHRLGGDVLRRLVLGLLRRLAVPRRHPSPGGHHARRRHRGDQADDRHGGAQRAHRRPLAAQAQRQLPRHLRSVGPAAGQHADPADCPAPPSPGRTTRCCRTTARA